MPIDTEALFNRFRSAKHLSALAGTCETSNLDCKEWPLREEDAQKTLAKAACGLANAEGGVIVVGMTAKSTSKDDPDVITGAAPVANMALVESKVLNLIGDLVEPGIAGIQTRRIPSAARAKQGFVLIHVPASNVVPHRSKKDWKFYRRIGNGTFPMDYSQIAEMFGRRPHPRLELSLEFLRTARAGLDQRSKRIYRLGIRNCGAGLARFPTIRYQRSTGLIPDQFGIDGNGRTGLPSHASESQWIIFRGGIDDVIFPGENLQITLIAQAGDFMGRASQTTPHGQWHPAVPDFNRWKFKKIEFECELACEGIQTFEGRAEFEEEMHNEPFV